MSFMFLFRTAKQELKDQRENLDDCNEKYVSKRNRFFDKSCHQQTHFKMYFFIFFPRFSELIAFFSWENKSGNNTPKEFFPIWIPFCNDFKDLWNKELQKITKEK